MYEDPDDLTSAASLTEPKISHILGVFRKRALRLRGSGLRRLPKSLPPSVVPDVASPITRATSFRQEVLTLLLPKRRGQERVFLNVERKRRFHSQSPESRLKIVVPMSDF
jgi:hypothetical protein